MIEIQTDRLILRTACSVENCEFIYPKQENTLSIFELPDFKPENTGFGIYLKTGELIGHIFVLFKRKPYELSYGIDDSRYMEKGYMSEAKTAVINWIFDNCSTKQIMELIGPITPIACRKMCERNGFYRAQDENDEWWILDRDIFMVEKT